ncbi:MAG: N-acetylmuramoyl-L-alanine amidase [Chthoniobacterales bacterium]
MAFVLAVFAASSRAASEWKVVKINGWDYLSVDNVAQFYGFAGPIEPIGHTIRLDNGRNQLEVTLDSREAIVNGVRNWLCFPVIEREGKYLVSRIDLAKTIEPQFRPHMIKNLAKLTTVVIDPGHGGSETGAGSSYGREKDFTLAVAKELKPLLEAKGLKVVLTRDKDELVPLPERARIANGTRDSIFVSIHFNATDYNSSATGFEIYSLTPRGAPSTQDVSMEERFANIQVGSPVDAQSLILSTAVYHAMLGYMPEYDRGVKRARFAVLRLTGIPAILVEGGFLSERQESREIATPQWRKRLAESIAVGIDSYRALVDRRSRPLMLADYRKAMEGTLVARNANAPQPNASTPPVFAASNNIAPTPTAQFTNAVHQQPSEPIPINQVPAQLQTAAAEQPPPPKEQSSQGPAQAQEEAPTPTPDDGLEPEGTAAPNEPNADLPDDKDQSTPPGPTATPLAPSPSPSPTPSQSWKDWFLSFFHK